MLESMEKLVALCKNRGYIYPGSEIYGGLANTWDYGPLGVELKNNVKKAWRKKFIQERKEKTSNYTYNFNSYLFNVFIRYQGRIIRFPYRYNCIYFM